MEADLVELTCPHCGAGLPPRKASATYVCTYCGRSFEPAPKPPPPMPTWSAHDPPVYPDREPPTGHLPSNRETVRWLLGCLVLPLFLVALSIVLFIVLGGGKRHHGFVIGF